jgi:integrase
LKYEARQEFYADAKDLGIKATFVNFAERSGVYSYNTADTYRVYWKECFQYAKENFAIKSIEQMNGEIIGKYMEQKISETTNLNTIDKISSAMLKMGVALDRVYKNDMNNLERLKDLEKISKKELTQVRPEYATHTDKIRHAIETAKEGKELVRPEQARAYDDHKTLIANLREDNHRVAGQLIQELGMRAHELSLIKPSQLDDNNKLKYISKGGQLNVRAVSPELADRLREYFDKSGEVRVNKADFRDDIRLACLATGQSYNGIHGLRWSVAQELMGKCLSEGKTYEEARGIVSNFLTHHRTYITEHYLKK